MHTRDDRNKSADSGSTERLWIAGVVSVVANILFLTGAAAIGHQMTVGEDEAAIAITLVSEPSSAPSVTPVQPRPKVQVAALPKPKPVLPTKPTVEPPKPQETPVKTVSAPVKVGPLRSAPNHTAHQGAHSHILTARSTEKNDPAQDFTVLSGGNGKAGQALARQEEGNAIVSPPTPAAPSPIVNAPVAPEASAPKPPPEPQPTPKVEPSPEPKPEPVQPSGPTRDAEPSSQALPSIPDSLKEGNFKSFVRVKVEVAEDGNFNVVLRTSSGNSEIDQRVLEALKRWKWKPALKNGVAIASTELFKFEFEVN